MSRTWRYTPDEEEGEMPKAMERKLRRQARKKGLGKERTDAYVYGTMRKTGWKPKRHKGK